MKPVRSSPSRVYSLLILLLFSSHFPGALAHTELSGTLPAANAVVGEAPERLALDFGGAVNLVKLALVDQQGNAVGINFKPATKPAKAFATPLPTLEPGQYTAKWTALGGDGHMLQGSFDFTVKPGSP